MPGKAFPFWLDSNRSKRPALAPFAERPRAHPRPHLPVGGSRNAERPGVQELAVEALDCEAATAYLAEWRDLAERSLEPNVFHEPACALAAAQHIVSGRRPYFIFVWEAQRAGALLAVCPLQLSGRLGSSFVRVWTHKQAALGTPLLDRARAAEALDAILAYCRRAFPEAAGLALPLLPTEGPVARLLRERAERDGRPVRLLDQHDRAVLSFGPDPDRFVEQAVAPPRLKKLHRARRRLEQECEVAFRMARSPRDVRLAGEQFLTLEARGWKGKRGTALLNRPQLATFARTLTRSLAKEGKCRIASFEVNGEPIAMLILLISGDRAFTWKIAYDEAYAAFSPGVQLMLELTRAQLGERGIALTDSCTAADHPMIGHIWPQTMPIADMFVGLGQDKSRAFAAALERQILWRRLRTGLKQAVQGLRRLRKA
ncbi:MAG: GNAT family N-acetyltransferase [Methylobacteriaceae bacterium]|nr:GNAT family N-acetyltransferase [Methylobacteriaceae bacterium]